VKLSVITPAHNEAAFIGACLDCIDVAAKPLPFTIEKIVVLNRCTDGTERIALEHGARVVHEEARNLSRIRNAGAQAASGEWLVTIDADSRMAPDLLAKVAAALADQRIVGGGVNIIPERTSLGIRVTEGLLNLAQLVTGLSAGSFWCRRADFLAVGGFDASLNIAEDADFAKRLRDLGRSRGQRYVRLDTHIVTSCRKFDRFGDWHWFTKIMGHPWRMRRALKGTDTAFTDEYFYDFNKGDIPNYPANGAEKPEPRNR
jgi:glycosyltransferase involved in cell wall biosynthesis